MAILVVVSNDYNSATYLPIITISIVLTIYHFGHIPCVHSSTGHNHISFTKTRTLINNQLRFQQGNQTVSCLGNCLSTKGIVIPYAPIT